MNPTGLAGPLRLVSSDRPARRTLHTSSCSAGSLVRRLRSPRGRLPSSARRAPSSSKNSTSRSAAHGSSSSLSRSRASANARCPTVWSNADRSRCSMAAAPRSASSTVACRASSTEAKKSTPRLRLAGRGTTRRIADVIPASVPSLPARIWVRSAGARSARSRP